MGKKHNEGTRKHKEANSNGLSMASNLVAMASNLKAMASNLVAMADTQSKNSMCESHGAESLPTSRDSSSLCLRTFETFRHRGGTDCGAEQGVA